MKRFVPLMIFAAISTGVVAGSYWLTAKFLRDREGLMRAHQNPRPAVVRSGPIQRTYTREELEQAKKTGKMPPGLQPVPAMPNTAGEAAIQRSLKTLEEINRINQQNQRLMEQQQRMQRQNK